MAIPRANVAPAWRKRLHCLETLPDRLFPRTVPKVGATTFGAIAALLGPRVATWRRRMTAADGPLGFASQPRLRATGAWPAALPVARPLHRRSKLERTEKTRKKPRKRARQMLMGCRNISGSIPFAKLRRLVQFQLILRLFDDYTNISNYATCCHWLLLE